MEMEEISGLMSPPVFCNTLRKSSFTSYHGGWRRFMNNSRTRRREKIDKGGVSVVFNKNINRYKLRFALEHPLHFFAISKEFH